MLWSALRGRRLGAHFRRVAVQVARRHSCAAHHSIPSTASSSTLRRLLIDSSSRSTARFTATRSVRGATRLGTGRSRLSAGACSVCHLISCTSNTGCRSCKDSRRSRTGSRRRRRRQRLRLQQFDRTRARASRTTPPTRPGSSSVVDACDLQHAVVDAARACWTRTNEVRARHTRSVRRGAGAGEQAALGGAVGLRVASAARAPAAAIVRRGLRRRGAYVGRVARVGGRVAGVDGRVARFDGRTASHDTCAHSADEKRADAVLSRAMIARSRSMAACR